MGEQGKPDLIRFGGPPIQWCDARVQGTGRYVGLVGCNRMLRDDGTCRNAEAHVPQSREHGSAADCPGAVYGPDAVCRACGHPAEQHSNADDLGDTQAPPAEAHRHIDHLGRRSPVCTAPIRADGTCTTYPPSNA